MIKLRNAYYCNLKLLLIFLVVFGHLIEPQISVSDGKIDVVGTSHKPGIPWLDAIDRALYPSAHSGY